MTVQTDQQTAAGDQLRENLHQHYEVLKELADCYAALNDPRRAMGHYLEAAELAPEKAGPYVGMGVLGIQTGRLGEAEQAFQTAAAKEPRCAEAYGGLAMVRQQRQDYPGAFDMYLKCLELDADNLIALLGLFQTSCQMGTFAKVIHYLELYLDRHPGDSSVQFCLASLYAREGRLQQAEDALLSVLTLEPDKAEAQQLLREVRSELTSAGTQEVLST